MAVRILLEYRKIENWLSKVLAILLCMIHDRTKYHTARSFQEIFYWPEGFCADMVVVALAFACMLVSLWNDIKIFSYVISNSSEE